MGAAAVDRLTLPIALGAFLAWGAAAAGAPTFRTLAGAAIRAEEGVSAPSAHQCREFAGVILRTPAGYEFTAPIRGQRHGARFVVEIPHGDRLAALYHTHPDCGGLRKDSRLFSSTDVRIAQRLGVPSFIWVEWDHTIREFIPGHTYVETLPSLGPTTPGRIITRLGSPRRPLVPPERDVPAGNTESRPTPAGGAAGASERSSAILGGS